MSSTSAEMPRYECHKIVHALKIGRLIDHGDKSFSFEPVEKEFDIVPLSFDFIERHSPQPGGYYVVYEDGYKSFSPAEPFEKGYTRIN